MRFFSLSFDYFFNNEESMSYKQTGNRKENNGKIIYASLMHIKSNKEQYSVLENCSSFSN